MADYYLQFSEVIPQLTDDEAAWLADQLRSVAVVDGVELTTDDLPTGDLIEKASWVGPKFLRNVENMEAIDDEPDFGFAFSEDEPGSDLGRHLWLYSEDQGDLDQVAELVQQFLKKFRPSETWSLTYATTCSKPCVGEFGGGAIVITAAEIIWRNAHDMVRETREAIAEAASAAG